MEPAKNKVVVVPHKPHNAVSALVLVDTDDSVYSGTVEAVGEGVTAVEPGQTAVFGRFSGVPVEDKIVLDANEILAVVVE